MNETSMDAMEDRLRHIETQQVEMIVLLRTLTEKVEERTAKSSNWHDKVERTVYGDGNGNKGHSLRLDRLEQDQERQKWLIRTLGSGLALLALKAVWALLGAIPG